MTDHPTKSPLVTDIKAFLDRYSQLLQEHAGVRFDQFTFRFGHLGAALASMREIERNFELAVAPRFNLFQLLGRARLEVNTHSRLLKELLDPEGTHGQGYLFLETLLKYLSGKGGEFIRFPQLTVLPASASWIIKREMHTLQGYLDIVVSSYALRLLVVIENKVDHGEEPDQLVRYHRWLETQSEYPPANRALIYLTPDGRQSYTAGGMPYFRLSYREDIAAWIRTALSTVNAIRVREVLAQYLEIVSTL
jgi:hypothetical protein